MDRSIRLRRLLTSPTYQEHKQHVQWKGAVRRWVVYRIYLHSNELSALSDGVAQNVCLILVLDDWSFSQLLSIDGYSWYCPKSWHAAASWSRIHSCFAKKMGLAGEFFNTLQCKISVPPIVFQSKKDIDTYITKMWNTNFTPLYTKRLYLIVNLFSGRRCFVDNQFNHWLYRCFIASTTYCGY